MKCLQLGGYNCSPTLNINYKSRQKNHKEYEVINHSSLERVPEEENFVYENKKKNYIKKTLLITGGLLLAAIGWYVFKGKTKNISTLKNIKTNVKNVSKEPVYRNSISERLFSNGKKVQKIEEYLEDGSRKVTINVFKNNGEPFITKEKFIKRSTNYSNGKKYINIQSRYNAADESIFYIQDHQSFIKNAAEDISKYYDKSGNLIYSTKKFKLGTFKDPYVFKKREAVMPDGLKSFSLTDYTYKDVPHIRSERRSFNVNGELRTDKFGKTGLLLNIKGL